MKRLLKGIFHGIILALKKRGPQIDCGEYRRFGKVRRFGRQDTIYRRKQARNGMFKRSLMILLVAVSMVTLSGCGKVQELTEEETRLIAEYAGGLLLKYDINYTDRIEQGSKDAAEMEATTEQVTTEAETEQETTEEVTTEIGKDVSGKIEQDTTEDTEATVGTEQDIAKIAGLDGVSVLYQDYIITNQYPETEEDSGFINLEASAGYELLVVRFAVNNTTEAAEQVSLIDRGLEYRIVCNGTKAANPMLTILMNDLGTFDMSVNPGEAQEAVLVFQISEEMKNQLESIKLYVNYHESDNAIDIL